MSKLVHLVQKVLVVSEIIVNLLHSHIFTQLDIGSEAVDIASHQIDLSLFLLNNKFIAIVGNILRVRVNKERESTKRGDLRGCMWI